MVGTRDVNNLRHVARRHERLGVGNFGYDLDKRQVLRHLIAFGGPTSLLPFS